MVVVLCGFFFFNDTATTEIYTLSLHDALPICWPWRKVRGDRKRRIARAYDRQSGWKCAPPLQVSIKCRARKGGFAWGDPCSRRRKACHLPNLGIEENGGSI